MTYRTNIRNSALLLSVALAALTFAACGDDSEETPPKQNQDGGNRPNNRPESGQPDASVDAGGRNDAGPLAGRGGADSGTPDGSAGDSGQAGTGAPECPEDPQTNEEFLNRCTDSQCEPFDNQERIEHPDYEQGEALPDDYP